MVNSLAFCRVRDGRSRRFDPGRVLRGGLYKRRGHRDLLVHRAVAGRFRSYTDPRAALGYGGPAMAIADACALRRRRYANAAERTPRDRCGAEPGCCAALAFAHD